jgi:DNA-binding XRE family transcriptional regulator
VDADTFARLRKRLGLNQTELAREIGVHRITVVNWSNGKNPIPLSIARLMACLDRERKWRKQEQSKRRRAKTKRRRT